MERPEAQARVLLSERGVVWEETIILLPDNVHYVFLSATIPNARQFAEWICHLHKQVLPFPSWTSSVSAVVRAGPAVSCALFPLLPESRSCSQMRGARHSGPT